jgi:hypothetical protein
MGVYVSQRTQEVVRRASTRWILWGVALIVSGNPQHCRVGTGHLRQRCGFDKGFRGCFRGSQGAIRALCFQLVTDPEIPVTAEAAISKGLCHEMTCFFTFNFGERR